MKYSIRFISLLTLIITAISMPVSALALDDSCISQRGYFNGCENIILIDDDGLSATAKYIADSDDGCFYFTMKFVDSLLSGGDKIHFKFTISNTLESISFDVDEGGIASYTSQNTAGKISAVSLFKIVTTEKGGNVIIGFEIKDTAYRKLLNSISCSYYCGDKRFVNILNNIALDMYEEVSTTVKSTASQKSSTASVRQTTSSASASSKANKTTTQPATKFVPKSTTSAQTTAGTSKFTANSTSAQSKAQTVASANTSATLSDEEYWSNEIADISTDTTVTTQLSEQSFRTSSLAKYIFILGIIVILAGIVILIIGLRKKSTEAVTDDNTDEDHSEE